MEVDVLQSAALNVPLRGKDNETTDVILRGVVEVFPQTAEMKRLLAKRLELEQQQREEEEERRRLELKEEMERQKREEDLKKLKQQRKKQRDIEERKRMEEEMKNREDDNLSRVLQMCLENETPAETSFSGLAFTQVQIRVLVNDTLRSLNVENCSFTCRGDEQSGVVELAKGLRLNKGLRNLNLRNNQIDDVSMHRVKTQECDEGMEGGDALIDALSANRTLTQLDVSFNDLSTELLRELHELLNRNQALFIQVKKHEKREREDMRHEEELMRIYLMHVEARRIMVEGAERRRIAREKAYEDRKAMMSRKKKGKGKKKK
ncbi:leucine rich repeat protein [Toxoplasma gondii ARI]|uniref:Leucine rich repeat protein n=1 Tax=Toxoplasma gondii ARI TaxID=1074872 RepID=A0A139XPI7_TOXGO|nr:leucine rich repeat protein [Toxoplasma gondii ARI]